MQLACTLHRHVRPPLSAAVHPAIISIIRSVFLLCPYLFNGSAYYLGIDLCQTLVGQRPSFCVHFVCSFLFLGRFDVLAFSSRVFTYRTYVMLHDVDVLGSRMNDNHQPLLSLALGILN